MGRSRRSALAPILRSEAQARILATLFLSPESRHLRALSDLAAQPYSVVQREVDRLEAADLVRSKRSGTSRVVRANPDHPLFSELRALLLKAYGPGELIGELLEREAEVEAAYLYGSWAARYDGAWGTPPADIDVLLVGRVSADRTTELEAAAEERLGQPVQIVVLPPAEWREATSPFVRTVKQRPLVVIREPEASALIEAVAAGTG
jgi:predicted nucleotidyltransferase